LIYENSISRQNEDVVKRHIEDRLPNIVLHHLTMKYEFDYIAITKGSKYPMGVIEIKSRGFASGAYPRYMLSLAKWNKGIQYSEFNKFKVFYFAKFTDCICYYLYRPTDKIDIEFFQGRKDRSDKNDVEPCVYIPMNLFKRL